MAVCFNISVLLLLCPAALGQVGGHKMGLMGVTCLMWPGKAISQSCFEATLVKLTKLSFFLRKSRSSHWDWRKSLTNVNAVWSWIQPLQPTAFRFWQWLTLFYVADMRQPRAGLIVDFHMAKVIIWKGHQKENIKTFSTTWKEKETIICSRSGFRGAARLSSSLALVEDFVPDPFPLHPFPVLSKQLCLFAIIPTPFCRCFALFQHSKIVFLWHWGASWYKCEARSFHTCWLKESWISKKEMWDRIAQSHYKICFLSSSDR